MIVTVRMPATTGISSSNRNDRMMRLVKCSLMLLLLVTCIPLPVWAQQRGVFLIQNPLQYVDFTYEYRNSSSTGTTNTTSSERHDFRPRYYLRFDYAIYDPNILQGTFAGSLKYDNSYYSSSPGTSGSKNGPGYELDVNGVFFAKKPLSAEFAVRNRDDLIMPEYSPSYDIYTDYYKAGLRYKSNVIPMSAYYNYVTTQTSGLSNDSTTTNSTVTFDAIHNYRQISVSKLSFTYNDMTNDYVQSTYNSHHTYYLSELNNSFTPTLGRFHPSFGTTLSYQKDSGDYAGSTYQARETFSCYLGRALETGANYSFFRIERDLNTQSQTTNNVDLWLEHQLYSSLRTRLSARGAFDRYQDGYMDTTSIALSTNYTKNLPDKGRLYFKISDSYEVKDQNFANSTQTNNIPKPLVFTNTTEQVFLDYNVETIIRAVTINNVEYFLNQDFELIQNGTAFYLRVLPGSNLASVLPVTLYITYTYQVNQAIKYGTNTFNISGNLSLQQNRYYTYFSYERRDQNLISGNDNVVALGPSSFFRVGGELRQNNNQSTLGLEYQNLEYITDTRNSVAAYWRYAGTLGATAFNTNLQDTYAWYSSNQSSASRSNYADNTFSAMLNLTRRLFRNSTITFTSNYSMIRGDSPSQDNLTFRMRYLWAMGKFRLAVDAQSFLRYRNGSNQINNLIKFEVRRYFW